MSVPTVAPGEYLFKREPADKNPYKVKVIMSPKDGLVGVQFSNGTIGAVLMRYLYGTWEEAAARPHYVAKRSKGLGLRLSPAHQTRQREKSRWKCSCGAVNLQGQLCWRCGKSDPGSV